MTAAADPADRTDTPEPAFTRLPDLASRLAGGAVVWANDELFAERENLIKPDPPAYSTYTFGHKGQVYDGWETRRRREPGHDWALVRLGMPGVVRGIVVDTSFFMGNYPPEISVDGAAYAGHPSPRELQSADWVPLVPRSPVRGDHRNTFTVHHEERITHVRLCQYPDGGVARLRVHGDVVPDPMFLMAGAIDLAALENGASVVACSNMFYSSPTNLISPDHARIMGEGWETARRRDDGNDWVEVALAGPGAIRVAELDTSYFLGNAPGWASLSGYDARVGQQPDDAVELLARERLQPDTRHRFRLPVASPAGALRHRRARQSTGSGVSALPEVTHVRLDVYPDGGMARLRLWGDLTPGGRDALVRRWYNLLTPATLIAMLRDRGVTGADAEAVVKARPIADRRDLPEVLAADLAI